VDLGLWKRTGKMPKDPTATRTEIQYRIELAGHLTGFLDEALQIRDDSLANPKE